MAETTYIPIVAESQCNELVIMCVFSCVLHCKRLSPNWKRTCARYDKQNIQQLEFTFTAIQLPRVYLELGVLCVYSFSGCAYMSDSVSRELPICHFGEKPK